MDSILKRARLAQQGRALAAKIDGVNFIPGTHVWKERTDYLK